MTSTMTYQRIKVIRSHQGLAEFLAQCAEQELGEIDRIKEIRSPYCFSPTHIVYSWNDRKTIVVETAHRRYEIFGLTNPNIRPIES